MLPICGAFCFWNNVSACLFSLPVPMGRSALACLQTLHQMLPGAIFLCCLPGLLPADWLCVACVCSGMWAAGTVLPAAVCFASPFSFGAISSSFCCR
jgi:hypothetical protein